MVARVVSTEFVEGPEQPDGRRYVKDIHMLDDGTTITGGEFLAEPSTNLSYVAEARIAVIHAELDARDEAHRIVVGTEVPHTKHDFLNLFSSLERQSIRRRAKLDENVQDFMEMLAASGGVYKSRAWPGLMYLAHIGEITFERADAITEAM